MDRPLLLTAGSFKLDPRDSDFLNLNSPSGCGGKSVTGHQVKLGTVENLNTPVNSIAKQFSQLASSIEC
jgi:hypothetical protein